MNEKELISAVLSLMSKRLEWIGTETDLKRDAGLPSGRRISRKLSIIAPELKRAGIAVDRYRDTWRGTVGARMIRLSRLPTVPSDIRCPYCGSLLYKAVE